MKLVIQRVKKAKVTRQSDGVVVGEIKKGLFILVGIKKGDTTKAADFLVSKLLKLRVMSDYHDLMNLSVYDTHSSLLVVSQFTLYADTTAGNRPSFIAAEAPDLARKLYEYFVDKIKESGLDVQTGSFGEYMKIDVELDGPVTILYEKDN